MQQIYKRLSKPKDQYNKVQQLGVSAVAGYIAGVSFGLSVDCGPRPGLQNFLHLQER